VDAIGGVTGEPFAWPIRVGGGGAVIVYFLKGGLLILSSYIDGMPLGRDRTMSSESHAAFHVTSKGISRMGVSSSSGRIRVRCSGVKPLWMCWKRYFAGMWSVSADLHDVLFGVEVFCSRLFLVCVMGQG